MMYSDQDKDQSLPSKKVLQVFRIADMFTKENMENINNSSGKETPTFNISIARIPICFKLEDNDFENSSKKAEGNLKKYFTELFNEIDPKAQ